MRVNLRLFPGIPAEAASARPYPYHIPERKIEMPSQYAALQCPLMTKVAKYWAMAVPRRLIGGMTIDKTQPQATIAQIATLILKTPLMSRFLNCRAIPPPL